jgi:hypothetical protein
VEASSRKLIRPPLKEIQEKLESSKRIARAYETAAETSSGRASSGASRAAIAEGSGEPA